MSGTATVMPRRDPLRVVKVHQLEKDSILVCYENVIQIVNLHGEPKQSRKIVSQLNFDYTIESVGE